jgi:hypothetical protein
LISRQQYEIVRGALERCAVPRQAKGRGPGTELEKLLRELGFRPCACCRSTADWMDDVGIDGCTEYMERILARLRKRAEKVGWWKKLNVALHGYLSVESLFDEALRRAQTTTPRPSTDA